MTCESSLNLSWNLSFRRNLKDVDISEFISLLGVLEGPWLKLGCEDARNCGGGKMVCPFRL